MIFLKHADKKQIPNFISAFRLLLVPVFAVLFFMGFRKSALTVFIIAEVSDVVDGFLARHFGWITGVGKILDPLADKIMQITVFVCVAVKAPEILSIVLLLGIKELLMLIGGIVLFKKGGKDLVKSKWFGKLSSCVLAFSLGALIVWWENKTVMFSVIGVSAVAVVFSLIMYLIFVYIRFVKGK